MKLAIKLTAILAGLAFLLIPGNSYAAEKTVKLTTYYPAPYGEYKHLNSTEDAHLATTSGSVGIGTTTPEAKLDVSSTTSGFLPPRMTEAQRDAIAAPPAGSLIYNTDAAKNRVEVWNGTSWSSALGWGGERILK